MKKLHMAGIAFIGLGVISLFTERDEDKAEKAGFSSVDAYELSAEAGFDSKTEYDALLEQQKLERQAKERGFEIVEAMQIAEQGGFDNGTAYDAHLSAARLTKGTPTMRERVEILVILAARHSESFGFKEVRIMS